MSATVLALVLFGALLHAGWNSVIKAGADKALDMALMRLAGLLLALPVLAWTGWPAPAAWPWLLLSGCIHFGYYYLLANAYERGQLSTVYPVMRGVAPVLVAWLGWTWLGEPFSPWRAGAWPPWRWACWAWGCRAGTGRAASPSATGCYGRC
ncbi:MAG: EamA family transporter [Burkholderiaceae bacterium]